MTALVGSLGIALLLLGGRPTERAGLKWEKSFEEALKRAQAENKPVLIDFWAEWCGWCHRLDETTYVDRRVVELGESFVSVKVDTEGGPKQAAIAERYDVGNLPNIVFTSPKGHVLLRVTGFQGPGQFPSTMERALIAGTRVMAWEALIDKDPKDAAALMNLGVHLFEQEFYEESRALLYRAAKSDARQPVKERKRTRMLIGVIQTYDKKYGEAESVLREALALQPPSEHEARLLFVLGRAYYNWGKPEEAREVMQELLSRYASSPMAAKARETIAALDRKK